MSLENPLVSVIIPVYNHERFVEECLKSAYQQTYPNLELILIDDGSTDLSAEIAESHLADCPFPHQFIKQENQGAHAAINQGMEVAQGEYLSILNSDDRYHPQRIAHLVKIAKSTKGRFLFSKVRLIDDRGKPLPRSAPLHYYYHCSLKAIDFFPTLAFELLRHNTTLTTGNFFFHRSLAKEIGPFANLITCHDWDYLLRAILVETPLFTNQELMDYRVHEDNTIQKYQVLREQEIDQIVSAYLEEVGQARNLQTPGPKAWGAYWPIFVDVYLKHMNKYPQTWKLLQEIKSISPEVNSWPAAQGIKIYYNVAEKQFNRFIFQERKIWEQGSQPRWNWRVNINRLLGRMMGFMARRIRNLT